MQTQLIQREALRKSIDTLSDAAIERLAHYVAFLRYEDEIPNAETIAAEISALEARYGTTPNAGTIAAMKELDEGGGDVVTMDELKAMLDEI
jgi:hypothetical protein